MSSAVWLIDTGYRTLFALEYAACQTGEEDDRRPLSHCHCQSYCFALLLRTCCLAHLLSDMGSRSKLQLNLKRHLDL